MKHLHFPWKALLLAALLMSAFSLQAIPCRQTGFVRDGINLTARLINPAATATGDIDATGCDIGIYYGPAVLKIFATVDGATIHNANAFGIVNDGANVTIENSDIHTIGVTNTFADQGYGIYFAIGSGAGGSITGNSVSDYRIAGIVVNGGLALFHNPDLGIRSNVVTGSGPNPDVAQTGIQLGFGATATLIDNTVISNSYTGTEGGLGVGILLFGGGCYADLPTYRSPPLSGAAVSLNMLIGDDVGIALYNLDAACNTLAAVNPVPNTVSNNLIQKYGVTNKTGWSVTPPEGYQAGIQVATNGDTISFNTICGHGYAPKPTPPPHLHFIDHATAIDPILTSNTTDASCIGVPGPAAESVSETQNIQATYGPIRPGVRY